jgi:hypothetical protein
MKKTLALLTLLLCCGAGLADVTVEGPAKVDPYKLVKLTAGGDTKGAALIWDVLPEDAADVDDSVPGKLTFTAPPGVYKIKLRSITIANGVPKVDSARLTVTIGQPPPAPTPPGPTPTPGPVTPTRLFAVVVEETAQLAAERGRIFADPGLTKLFADKGHAWRIVDKDVMGADGKPPADVTSYLARAAGKGYPQLYLVNTSGRLLWEGNLPATAADLSALVTKIGG